MKEPALGAAQRRTTAAYVDSRWGQVHYRINGSAGPWVALFHESPLSSRVFEGVLPLLGQACRAVAFDTPGYGSSDPPPSRGFEIPDYAEVLAEAMAGIGISRPVLGGVHTGASIAIEAARHVDGGAAALVLSGVPLFTADERADFLESWTPVAPVDHAGSQFCWAVERYRRIWGGDASADMLHLAVVELMRNVGRYDWAYRAAFRHDPGPSLSSIDAPVLLLGAEFDMLADKDPIALSLARHARLVLIEGISGQPHLRAPHRYATEIIQLLSDTHGA